MSRAMREAAEVFWNQRLLSRFTMAPKFASVSCYLSIAVYCPPELPRTAAAENSKSKDLTPNDLWKSGVPRQVSHVNQIGTGLS
jgi:hypothetical protein